MRTITAAGLIFALATAGAGTAACSKPSDKADAGTLRVGVTVEETGPVPVLGLAEKGIRAAAADLNKRGGVLGKKIELLVRDNAGDPSRAIQNVREFDDKGVEFVVGPVFGQDCSAVAPELAKAEMVGLCLSPNDLPERTSHMFGVGVGYTPTTKFEIEWMTEQGDTAGILAAKDESSDETVALAKKFGEPHGLKIEVERFAEGDTSAKPQLQRLIGAGSDVILLPSCGPSTITAAKEAIELGFEGKVLVENCHASMSVAKSVKGFANDQVYVMAPEFMLGTPPADSPRAAAIRDYQTKLGDLQITIAAGWDGMNLLAKAITKAGAVDADKVRTTLEGDFHYVGVWSTATITADDHRGAVTDGALIPSYFTREGGIERAPGAAA